MTLSWMLHRITRRSRTHLLLGILLICTLVLGGVTRSYSANMELFTLNMAFGTQFATAEEFLSWHRHWQYTWLVSALDTVCVLPFLVNIFPRYNDPELTVPVVMGRSRSGIFFSGLCCFDLAVVILWLGYLLAGCLLGSIPLIGLFPASYYLRTMGIALLLQLGYANLALAVAQLFRSRVLGCLVGFAAVLSLNVMKNLGLFWNVLSTISYANRDRDQLWMWAVESHPTLSQLLTLILFPIITTALSCLIGLISIHRRDLA